MMYVYYHGFWKFAKTEKEADSKPDTETQKLIEDINGG
jgi:hypothetical protein